MPLVLTYSRALPNIGKILNKHQQVLRKSEQMREIFKEIPITAYRRDKNLGDILIHEKTSKTLKQHKNPGTVNNKIGCGRRCQMFTKHKHSDIKDSNGRPVVVTDSINCRTCNVVYGIYCEKCEQLVYIGETRNMLKSRIQSHLSSIRNKNTYEPVPVHFNSHDHTTEHFKFVGLEKVKQNRTIYRRNRESYYIKKYDIVNNGLNIKQ